VDREILAALQKHFDFHSFRPGQAEAIQSLLDEQHTLVVMPTGAGKSLIYQLAALHLPGVTVVISPLIALMKDQVDSLEKRGIEAAFINSMLSAGEQSIRLRKLAEGCYRLIYVAPERLRSVQFLQALKQRKISLLAVDEAHCISEWGHDFRPDYLHIAEFRSQLANPLTTALTATATPQVQKDIARLLGISQPNCIVTGFNRPNLFLELKYISNQVARLKNLRDLLENHSNGAAIIYTGTRRDAEETAEFITTVVKKKASYYHAGLPADERTRIQDAFMTGKLSIVSATNAFGMGIDRQDVRLVAHYSIPGSLEAYYQEAGRAGRDGQPAQAVLFYSPEDRALQEWFIENSTLAEKDLKVLYGVMKRGRNHLVTTTINELSYQSGLPEVKVCVGMAELESAEAMERLGDDGLHIQLRILTWDDLLIQRAVTRMNSHQHHRREQLNYMIAYAESNQCRRSILLDHFGDPGTTKVEVCCDNCQAQVVYQKPSEAGVLTQEERVALIVLDTVRRLKYNIGREKLAQILKGSQAQDILKFGYDRSPYYARLAVCSMAELIDLVDQLVKMSYLKVIGGKYPVLSLTPQGEAAIRAKAAIPVKLQHTRSDKEIERKKAERQAGGTIEYTAQLFAQGLSIDQIANHRGLSVTTIYGHIARLIATGRVTVDAVVPGDVRQRIEAAIQRVKTVEFLAPIKSILPDEIDYGVVRCVVEHWKREQQAKSENDGIGISPDSEIEAFLSHSLPRPLPGPWRAGWALDFHSQFRGASWHRSPTGELAYRLKYQEDLSVLPALVDQAAKLIAEHAELAQVDGITPVPPSTLRSHDPLYAFTQALGQRLALPYLPLLIKARSTKPQKEMHTLAQKHANVVGAFRVQSSLQGKRILVVDDLYDSGATLEVITHLLIGAGAASVCVLTITRTIHSDA